MAKLKRLIFEFRKRERTYNFGVCKFEEWWGKYDESILYIRMTFSWFKILCKNPVIN